ncbi:hypothetical protein CEXT_87741 [Caerostris extrusa]|uniref:Uncharacterized protein n=1 Tax=Caerostris extrusa TaxID=172846 RepID=A0AAV4Y409_CAEEX|nr:hypothetical protein CEXT_87741 [Caerostris extrusa]
MEMAPPWSKKGRWKEDNRSYWMAVRGDGSKRKTNPINLGTTVREESGISGMVWCTGNLFCSSPALIDILMGGTLTRGGPGCVCGVGGWRTKKEGRRLLLLLLQDGRHAVAFFLPCRFAFRV